MNAVSYEDFVLSSDDENAESYRTSSFEGSKIPKTSNGFSIVLKENNYFDGEYSSTLNPDPLAISGIFSPAVTTPLYVSSYPTRNGILANSQLNATDSFNPSVHTAARPGYEHIKVSCSHICH